MRKNPTFQKAKRSILLIMAVFLAVAIYAVPAKPGQVRTITLTNGTTVKAHLVGDEYGHFWLAENGKAYLENENGTYSEVSTDNVTQKANTRRSAANAQRAKRLAPHKVGEVGNYTGKKKGIIILVNFTDKKFATGNNQALYERIANKENFSEGNFKGSMYDYFYAQSEGKFELTFDVVGPYDVSQKMSYYGGNDSSGDDLHPAEMVIEALKKADPDVNFKDYDWDGNGEVDQVYVVYAGKGEADGGATSTIWPHEWQLSAANYYGDGSGPQKLDGVTIDTYACGSELDGSSRIAGIGTMCHEFSHCLGYPDFYDTDYSGGQGMGYWDLMDSGSYNGDGYQPAGYTSYERWVAGWKEPIVLSSTQSVTGMKAINDGGESYIIYNHGNTNEYFLLENRQKTGWDASLPGKGLLIFHVDYDATIWANNKPNDTPSRQRMTWIPADNEYQYTYYQGTKYYTTEGMAKDTYPYGSVNAFNKSTTPAAKFYNKNTDGTYYMSESVEGITQNADKTISFNFKGLSNVAPPVFSPKPGQYENPVLITMSCDTKGATIYYTTNGTTPTTNSTRYTQSINITKSTTFKAISVKDGEVSDVVTANYEIVTAPPTFSPEGGKYAEAQNVTISCNTEGASIYYTTDGTTPTSSSTHYTKAINVAETTTIKAIAIANGVESEIVSATYRIGETGTMFKRVEKIGDLESGKRYIIACGSKAKASGKYAKSKNSTYLSDVDVEVDGDIITIDDDCEAQIFTLTGSGSSWSIYNETNGYLYATAAKKVAFQTKEPSTKWTLSDDNSGVIMKYKKGYSDYGTMLYNVNSPRFTTYTSSPSANMIYANLYMEYVKQQKQDVTMSFSETEATATIGNEFTAPTLTISPEGLAVTYSSSDTDVATVDDTGTITLVGAGTTTITATFAGNNSYNPGSASYTLTVEEGSIVTLGQYVLVSRISQIQAGDEVIIVGNDGDTYYAISTTQDNNNRKAVTVTMNQDGTITGNADVQVIKLEKDESNWLFNVGNGYLYAASSSKNYLKTETDASDNAKAKITIDENGATSIIFQGSNTHNVMQFNLNAYYNSPLFSCYLSATQSPVTIYRKQKALLGDADGDGEVGLVDVMLTVEYILNDGDVDGFVFTNADVVTDEAISLADVMGIVEIILNK